MIILLDMTQNWNDDWVSKEDERYSWLDHIPCLTHCHNFMDTPCMMSSAAYALLHWMQVSVCSLSSDNWCLCGGNSTHRSFLLLV